MLGAEWINPIDNPPLEDQFETFEQPRWKTRLIPSIQLMTSPFPGRCMLESDSSDRMIQIQPTRFHYNWRKRDASYPSYETLIKEFLDKFSLFTEFVGKHQLGELVPNQWELTYVNAFASGDYWATPADWPQVLPGLFGNLFPAAPLKLALENRSAEWTFEIQPKVGRLHISARTGRSKAYADQPVLLLQMTSRGPVGRGGTASVREGLDIGHDATIGAFLELTDKACQSRWGLEK